MTGSIVAEANNFHALYGALETATQNGDRLQVQEKTPGVTIWRTQNSHLRRFLNVLTLSGYGRYQDKKVAQALAQAVDKHASHLSTRSPDYHNAQAQFQVFKSELTGYSDQGLVTGNFFKKLAAKLGTSASGTAALNWIKQHTASDLVPPATKLPYQSEASHAARVDNLKAYALANIREQLINHELIVPGHTEAIETLVDKLGERVLQYLAQREQASSPAELAKSFSHDIATDIKRHLDEAYDSELSDTAWAVGEYLGVFLGEVEADVPGKTLQPIVLPQPEPPVATPTEASTESSVSHIEQSAIHGQSGTITTTPPSSQQRIPLTASSLTPLATGVRGVAARPSAVTKPSGAIVDYFDSRNDNPLLERLTPFEVNRGRLAQVLNDPNWIEQETGPLFSETQQATGKKAQKRLERHTAFAQLSDKKQKAIFEKLEKRVHEAQAQRPTEKLDEDWFAEQLRSSTERVLDKRFVGVSKGVKTFHAPKHDNIKHQAKEKAALHVQGARTTINMNSTLAERSLGTRILEGVDSVLEQIQGQGGSAIGFDSSPQRSKIDSWIAKADFGPLREVELAAFEKQFIRRAGAFAEVNQHWLREEDWQALAVDTVRDLRQRAHW